MELEYYTKHVYGKQLMYLAKKEEAQHIQNLTGKKTVDESMCRTLTALGFTFKEVLPPKED